MPETLAAESSSMNANTNSAKRAIINGGKTPVDGGTRQLAPCHSGPDAISRQQRVHRSSLTRLASAELVGAVKRRRQRRAWIGLVRPGSQLQKGAERHLHGALDSLAHPTAECVRVAGHLDGDRGHSALGDLGQPACKAATTWSFRARPLTRRLSLGGNTSVMNCSLRTK